MLYIIYIIIITILLLKEQEFIEHLLCTGYSSRSLPLHPYDGPIKQILANFTNSKMCIT